MNEQTATKPPFEAWALVEIMGHQRAAGRVTEEMIAGAMLLRVDIPTGDGPEDFVTQYLGGASIFRLTPTTEAQVRLAVRRPRILMGRTMNQHIEAAAAAIKSIKVFRPTPEDMAQAAYHAIVESLASAGEDGVVDAMRKASAERGYFVNHDSMRAALAVARLSMGEVERDAERYRWLRAEAKNIPPGEAGDHDPAQPVIALDGEVANSWPCYGVAQMWGGKSLDEAIDAARAAEGGGHE